MQIFKRNMSCLLLVFAALICLTCGPAGPVEDNQVEVFSWWTSGGESAALEAVFQHFKTANPDIAIINSAVAGGGGSAARPILQTRLVGGNPPDTWQTHPGAEILTQYVAPGFVAPLTDIYQEEGLFEAIPKQLLDMVSKDGVPYLMILNVHRSNELWYNKKLLEDNGIEVGESLSFEQFFEMAETLRSRGITPLAVGDAGIWATGILFENTLAGTIGPEKYLGLWDGSVSFAADEVKEAIRRYGRMLDYQNSDHAALSWDQAVKKMIEGSCAFTPMGDWAYGEMINAGAREGLDFGWVSSPGTDHTFVLVSDGFAMARNAPHQQSTMKLLRSMGSTEGQIVFNQLKGSIPARVDCDRSRFSNYLNWSMDSFSEDTIIPTIIHGSAAPADFQQALNDGLTAFVVNRNVDMLANYLVEAARSAGFGK